MALVRIFLYKIEYLLLVKRKSIADKIKEKQKLTICPKKNSQISFTDEINFQVHSKNSSMDMSHMTAFLNSNAFAV
jgi:hypothetical protein